MIEFKEGAVCFSGGRFWRAFGPSGMLISDRNIGGLHYKAISKHINSDDFQLNEPREGWYIPKSELDTEEKYNRAVEVFGLFGFNLYPQTSGFEGLEIPTVKGVGVYINQAMNVDSCEIKCTFDQLMAIGELKRKMDEREGSGFMDIIKSGKNLTLNDVCDRLDISLPKNKRHNKSKQAYDILKGLDYEYDEAKQQWFKKVYVND